MTQPEKAPAFEALLDYLKRGRGFDFSGYKRASLMRRVRHRMQAASIEEFSPYMDYLQVHPDEFTQLFNTILINVTAFFRDEAAWEYVAREIIPRIIADAGDSGPIRVWSAGCASGEEAYTLAMLLAEVLGTHAFLQRVKIYATDVDEEALLQARQASYTAKDLQAVPPALREKYFVSSAGCYVFQTDLRRAVIFGRHDLVQDAPISRLDLLVCRNTLMYLNAETQGRILARFHFALNDRGYLFLGKAELLLTHMNLFTPVEVKHRVFRRAPRVNLRDRLLVMAQAGDTEAVNHLNRIVQLRDAALESSLTAQLVIDLNGNLAFASERARVVFGVDMKDIGRPFQDLELSYRPAELRSLMERAHAERRTVRKDKVLRRSPGNSDQCFDVDVTPLSANGGTLLGTLITFDDVTAYERLQMDLQRANEDLETSNQELQSAHEELETTNEELQSTNEELETTNEELQSTNEELETMNEELQSSNEELQAINDELRQRTGEVNTANAFLAAMLANLPAGVVVVDTSLTIRLWNQQSEDLWGVRAEEAVGKSLLSLDIGLPVAQLPLQVFAAGNADRQVLEVNATNRRGKAIKCQVTCTPFIGTAAQRDGAVLLMEDVTEQRQQAARILAESIVATVREPLVVLDADLRILFANRSFYQTFRVNSESTDGRLIFEIGSRQWDVPELRRLLEEILPQSNEFQDYEVMHDFPVIGRRSMRLNARQIYKEGQHPQLILLAIEDVTGDGTPRGAQHNAPP